jgi:intein/homing endonuclease
MDHIVYHCPGEALNKLEEISYLLKQGDEAKVAQFLKVNENMNYQRPADSETKAATQEYISQTKNLFVVSISILFLTYYFRKK